jgi:Polyketide cyclase / dehydrase and lipid transport
VNEVTALEPGRRLAMRSVKAPSPMEVDYEFEESGRGTLMRVKTRGEAGGFYKLAGPMLAAAVRRGVGRDLDALKRLLESA